MKTYRFKGLLQEEGWVSPAYVSVGEDGCIVSIDTSQTEGNVTDLNVYALPGFQNAHSHAFQYAMAGLAETHSTLSTPDDFWSWREAMYQLALSVEPDQLENIAAMLYAEMLRHGYTNVAEFHYVHHDKNGKPYSNPAEMGERLVAAAARTGINITLIPIFYQKGGFGKPATDGQKRFLSADTDAYLRLLEASGKAVQSYAGANLAIGIHSMRGVEPELIKDLANNGPQNFPFHIHISEQLKEIEDSLSYLGKRPVQWMLDEVSLSDRFHLVHATHLDETETAGLARSGANVVLCPTTEGNLGDGIFPLRKYQECGGQWSIGTDSHVSLNPFEELRLLDYGQRLISHKRNTYYNADEGDSGSFALKMALRAGRKAMGESSERYFSVGSVFNAALISAEHPLLQLTGKERLLSTILYASDATMQYGTISRGKLVVAENRHVEASETIDGFRKTIEELGNR